MAKSENLTVLLTDIVNFSEKTASSTRADMGELLRIHNRLLKSAVHFYGGQYVKSTGDGMLAVFRTTTNAVQCGMAIQDTIAEYNQGTEPERELHVRIALNLGEVSWSRRDVMGEAVNVTARIEEITPADEIYISGTVYLAMNRAEVATRFVDKVTLKGVEDPVAIHMVPRNERSVLVATGEPAGSMHEGALPYGGMPRPSAISRRERLFAIVRQPLFIASASMLLTILLLGTIAYSSGWLSEEGEQVVRQVLEPAPLFTPSANGASTAKQSGTSKQNRHLVVRGEQLLAAGKVDELRALIETAADQGEPAAGARLLEGHLAHQDKNWKDAMDRYAEALKLSPRLRHNDLLAQNLVATLGYLSKPASALIEQHQTSAMISYLSQRTAQPGPLGRAQAVRLLTRLGHEDAIDQLGYGSIQLQEARSCNEHKTAIDSLRQSGNPAAIPVLEEALGSGLGGWLQSRCWRDEAKAAINALQEGG